MLAPSKPSAMSATRKSMKVTGSAISTAGVSLGDGKGVIAVVATRLGSCQASIPSMLDAFMRSSISSGDSPGAAVSVTAGSGKSWLASSTSGAKDTPGPKAKNRSKRIGTKRSQRRLLREEKPSVRVANTPSGCACVITSSIARSCLRCTLLGVCCLANGRDSASVC